MITSYSKALIVEDEDNIRNLIRTTVDWESLGIAVVGEASTGLEALDLIEQHRPDIVLTDIEMPYMDGLTLSQRILQRYSGISVIILTAHGQFDYAQQALKHGVSNYILKPIDKERIEDTLRAAMRKIAARRTRLSRLELSHNYVQDHKRFFRDRSLEEMIHRGHSEGLEAFLDMLGIRFARETRFSLAVMTISRAGSACTMAEKYLMLSNCKTYIEEQYITEKQIWVLWDRMEGLVLLSADAVLDFTLFCQQIMEDIEQNMRCRVYFGLGDTAKSMDQLPVIYRGARDALRLAMLAGESAMHTHASISIDRDQKSLDRKVHDLILYVKNGLQKNVSGAGHALLSAAASQRGDDLNASIMFAMHVLARAMNELTEAGIPSKIMIADIASVYERFLRSTALHETAELLEKQLIALSGIARTHLQDHSSHVVSGVLRYLSEHFGDADLSLSSLADHFGVNSSYLSRIFKANTGKPFSEYLIELRIRHATQLLQANAYKAYQLAQFVGIPDPGYFTKCFKKVTGISFQSFKATVRQDSE